MGLFSSGKRRAAASKAGQKQFRAGKTIKAKHAAAHADAAARRAKFAEMKRNRRAS